MASAGRLTPWAAEFRYDDAPLETLDRDRAVVLAEFAAEWCRELISEASP